DILYITLYKFSFNKYQLKKVLHFDCSFDQDLCNWNQMITDAFDWTWQSGSTPTLMTGPSADHTGGHYLYIEASSQPYGNTARLISPESSDSGPQCLRFWYHMYGSADTMGLHVYLVQGRWAENILQPCFIFHINIIIFEGRRGSNIRSDVAIDDVRLHHGPCAGNNFLYISNILIFCRPLSAVWKHSSSHQP
uniref:MAM domain-containing protein n=1 Tax=Sphaeramia orbicularis TaxID=375764 RepID=A0A673B172_9TELE